MRPDAIFFDVGMTLIHVDSIALTRALSRVGVHHVDPDVAKRAFLLAADGRHRALPETPDSDADARVGRMWGAFMSIDVGLSERAFRLAIDDPALYRPVDPEAIAVLNALRSRRIALGALANGSGHLQQELLAAGLLEFFDVLVDSSDVGVEKPAPAIFEAALRELGVSANRVWYVGDGVVTDILGALNAGFERAVLFDWSGAYSNLPYRYRIQRLTQLLSLVEDQS